MHRAVHGARRGRKSRVVPALGILAGAVVVVSALVVLPGWGHHPDTPTTSATSNAPATAVTSSTPTTPTTVATAPAPTADGTYRVASTTVVASDTSVPPGEPARSLPTQIWYPAGAAAAPPRGSRGHRRPYPLLVFSQGFDEPVDAYAGLLGAWASAGFVVAAPTYPDTDPSPTIDESDILNHPADLRSVIGDLLALSDQPHGPLSGLIDTGEIGLVGQSDGGDVTLVTAEGSCCRYPGVKAVAVLSGAELSSFGGQYFTGPATPLLVVQGNADPINPPACSMQLYDAAPPPKWYLDLLGADHLEPYVTAGAYEQVTAAVTTDFFDAELAGQQRALASMAVSGNAAGVAALTDGGEAPPATGSCPGAP